MQYGVRSLIPKTLFLASSMALCCLVPLQSATAQITPDSTLGAERSVVTPNVNINGLTSDRIDGGATRGVNLFHSFGDFNVGAGRGVYFSNPAGIENILTRVTGNNASNILGTLGVLGNANLFLLNPNGIIFGSNARLDLRGSFLATTASSFVFGNGLEFSATNPQAPPLLTINFPPGLQYRSNQPGVITNAGNLTVGQDLTLAAGNLDLQGQLQAGRNLTLQALDTVQVRDSVTSPFMASSGGQLLVQGNQGIDISALNHPGSGFFSGADMVLRSGNTVGGDAHFTADGNFRIEKLDGSLGELSSPHDPVILANGDVNLGNYTGASMHILAGGSVDLGKVTINGTGTTANTISPNSSNSFLAKLANVSLSNGTSVVIDGSTQTTLDIRAGIDWRALGGLPGVSPAPTLGSTATTAGITTGQINNNYLNSVVLLTNQYSPDRALSGGTITAKGQINAYSGSVTIDARDNLTVAGGINTSYSAGNGGKITLLSTGGGIDTSARTLNSSSNAGNGGEITLTARNNIKTGNLYANSFGAGNGGKITLLSTGGGIDTSAGLLQSTSKNGNGEAITLTAQNNITTGELDSFTNGNGNGGNITLLSTGGSIDTSAGLLQSTSKNGNGGAITLTAQNNITTGNLYSAANPNAAGTYSGNGGDVTVLAHGDISLNSGASIVTSGLLGGNITLLSSRAISATGGLIGSSSSTTQQGVKGGDVNVIANSLSFNEARLFTATAGGADAGNVNIKALDAVTFNGVEAGAVSAVGQQGATGNGGNINITTGSLSVTGGAFFGASTLGLGHAGSININVRDTVTFDGRGISPNTGNIAYSGAETGAGSGAEGKGGDITISARSLFLSNGAYLTTSPLGGLTNAGNILVNATDSISINSGAIIFSSNFGQGNGGNITLRAGEKVALSGDSSEIVTSQLGGISGIVNNGSSGNINIQTGSLFLSNGAQLQSGILAGGGDSGNILVNATHSIFMNNGAYIGTTNAGQGNGGNVTLIAGNKVSLTNDSTVGTNGEGNGNSGNINIQTGSLSVSNRSGLTSAIYGRGSDAGNITILASGAVSFDGVDTADTGVSSAAERGAIGNAGNVKLTAQSLSLTNGAFFASNSQGGGAAGSIEVTTTKDIHLDNGASIASNTSGGQGNITLSSRDLFLRHNSNITTNATGTATGGNITINTGNLVAVPKENSDISANAQDSFGGRISITAAGIFGTQYRPHLTPLSDITATSNLGPQFNGTVQLNILSPDPTRGLAELPQNVIDPASQIANNPCTKGKSSEFTIAGRGGLPPNPHEALNSDAVSVGLVDVPASHQGSRRNTAPVPTPKTTIQEPIVPAQGWVYNDKGQVVLTAYNPAVTQPQRPWRNPGACHTSDDVLR